MRAPCVPRTFYKGLLFKPFVRCSRVRWVCCVAFQLQRLRNVAAAHHAPILCTNRTCAPVIPPSRTTLKHRIDQNISLSSTDNINPYTPVLLPTCPFIDLAHSGHSSGGIHPFVLSVRCAVRATLGNPRASSPSR